MTDVRDDAAGPSRRSSDEPSQDLDSVLTRWGSEQSGPWRRPPTRRGGRHAAPESTTFGDARSRWSVEESPASGHSPSLDSDTPAAAEHRPDHPSWPAGSGFDRPAPVPAAAGYADPPTGGGRRRRPDGVPPAFPTPATTAGPAGTTGAAPGPAARAPVTDAAADPAARAAAAGPIAGSYAGPVAGPSGGPVADSYAGPVAGPYADPFAGPSGGPVAGPSAGPVADSYAGPVAGPSGGPVAGPYADPFAGRRDGHGPDRPGGSAPAEPPRFDDTGAYVGWLSSVAPSRHAATTAAALDAAPAYPAGIAGERDRYATQVVGAVGLLERPEPYALPLRTDLPLDPDDDETPGRHRRTVGPRRTRRPRWARTLGWVGAFLGILLVAGGYQYERLSGNIHRVDALSPRDASIRDAARQLDAENYLLIGSDTRAGENGEYGTVTGARSDTTILAHLSPNRDKAILISFPRDSWVHLPACPKTGGGTAPAHDDQFNEAFTIGGPACTVLAVQKLTGIKINHYVQVDFTGFKTMVDALNGVSICTTTPLRDDESGLRLPAGTSRLRGEQALAYVRARYGIGDGSDLGRIQRQQRFLGAMIRTATSTKLLVNPVALTKFLTAATRSLTLDKQTSFGDLKQLAQQLHGLDPKRVSFLTAPIANAAYTPPGFPPPPPGQGGSRVLLDDVAGRALYDSVINDKPQPPKAAARPSGSPKPNVLTVAPQEISVRVLNGVGVGGLGRKVSGDLRSVGFGTVEPADAPATTVSTVRYAPANKAEAETLAAAVPGAVLRADPSTDLELVVGSNYTGVRTVRVGEPAPATATPAPKPTAAASTTPAVTAADARCD